MNWKFVAILTVGAALVTACGPAGTPTPTNARGGQPDGPQPGAGPSSPGPADGVIVPEAKKNPQETQK